jgi:alpha-tubulin suppressor-like RCC1 family protein
MFQGSIVKPGFNPLAAQTVSYLYNLFAWGVNNQGQLGTGNTTQYLSPAQVGSLTNWTSLSPNQTSSLAIKTDGTLWSWGNNSVGQLGLNNTTYYSSPKQVGALTNWSKIAGSSGANNTLAIKTDGTLWSWGYNHLGQLGLGTSGAGTYKSSPTQVGALTSWLTVACGYAHGLAIKTDGTLWSWGMNFYGQLGLGNRTYYSSPKQVGALTTWSSISGGFVYSLAVKTDGTIWSWGGNGAGPLGLGNTTNYSSPMQIGALTTWSKIGNGNTFSFAIKTDGALWSWGNNFYGQLGLGTSGAGTYKSSPNQVGALTTWSTISGGSGFALATKTDGTLWSWGQGNVGQLGLGNSTNYSSPKQVGSSTTWSKFACSGNNAIAIG